MPPLADRATASDRARSAGDGPLLLFYNSAFGGYPDIGALASLCGCRFTTDRARLPEADAVIFHLPSVKRIWEAEKYRGQLWIAWCMESEAYYPALRDPGFMAPFDMTMTYRRDGDVWCSYLPAGFEPVFRRPVPPKTEAAPLVIFQSNPFDRSGRAAYIAELLKRIRVDVYGRWFRNRELDMPDRGPETKLATIARYRFCLAFENSIADDYVTEKFFEPLVAGSVPVYRGAPNIRDFAPTSDCFVNIDDFAGPAELARYLDAVAQDETAYRRFHRWREEGPDERFRTILEETRTDPFCRLCAAVCARPPASRPAEAWPSTRPLAHLRPSLFRRTVARLRRAARALHPS